MLSYPIKMTFKLLALAPQIYVTDAAGTSLFYVKQKLLKLKEHIEVFRDESKQQLLYNINADRIIDWSAKYHIKDAQGNDAGYIQRHGAKSMWRAHYDIFENGQQKYIIQEKSVLVRFLDGMFGEIPVLGVFTGYVFNPTYLITHATGPKAGQLAMQVVKRPSLLERNFWLELHDPEIDVAEQAKIILGMLMVALLERTRG